MPSVEEALRIIDEKTPAYIVVDLPVTASIIGSVLAEDVYAAERVPVSRTSMIDGYAIISRKGRSTKGVFPTASIASIHGALQPLQPGYVARIARGESLPPNANAIVMVEDTAISSQNSSGDTVVEILADDVIPGENVSEPGSDIPLASKILARGDLISPTGGEVGLLAATGIRTVKVFKKPRVGVLSIGDELIEHSDPRSLVGGQTRDSNRISLLSCLASWGFETADLGIVHASSCALERSLRDMLGGFGFASPEVDMLVTTSNIPLSKLGYGSILERLGGSIHFDRVSMKPGISTNFATVPSKPAAADTTTDKTRQQYNSKLVFSLPGDPASALVTLNLFVLYSIQKLAGLGESSQALASKPWIMPQLGLPRVAVVLTHHFYLDPKFTEYHRVVVTGSRSDGRLYATSTGANVIGQLSSRVGSLAKANALLVLRPGRGVGIKGEIMEALMMGPIHGSDTRIIC
jgi:gephyrin